MRNWLNILAMHRSVACLARRGSRLMSSLPRARPRRFRLDQVKGVGSMDKVGVSDCRLISPQSPRS